MISVNAIFHSPEIILNSFFLMPLTVFKNKGAANEANTHNILSPMIMF